MCKGNLVVADFIGLDKIHCARSPAPIIMSIHQLTVLIDRNSRAVPRLGGTSPSRRPTWVNASEIYYALT